MKNRNTPNYQKIFNDILTLKFPEKKEELKEMISKKELSYLDVIEINNRIFEVHREARDNQKHRSYDKETILSILSFQKEKHLNNSELAQHFKLSRNTVTKWRRLFA
ncbi:helix-turn-helix domain-containing protein [Chryseobacterium tructae]|uniref:Helix-turn-helix domain-containing protein n=1 Tax=Chryseobacterium tructae TaxID=1037380 RepID=A0ABV7Y1D7_9FLAO|nr:helix-turn-helix domain-containing protein [Chryseobacterium tructae]MDN3693651.1 helix-turn-helix domain-containing protein [Chryseobacterium tructae]